MKIIDANTFFGFWPKRKVDVSLKKLLEIMEKHKVDKSISLSLKGIFYDHEEGNEETLRMAKKYSQIIPAATIDLRKYFGKGEIVKKILEQGFKVLKLFPNLQGWPISYAPFYRLLEETEKFKIPLMITIVVKPFGFHHLGMITEISKTTKGLKIPVILTSFDNFYYPEVLVVMKENSNIYVETSLFNTPDSFEIFITEVGEEKIIFGSNSPLNYLATPLICLKNADISKKQKEKILSKNITSLLKKNL
jgi:predicted TIM-barrel fold metal-dependent hydrolase